MEEKEKTQKLLAELSRGAQLTFANAEQLYREAKLLSKKGAHSRALLLHQISLEECGKIEMIGGWATTLFLGRTVNVDRMIKALRSHEAKNYANAYFTALTEGEKEAKARGDRKAAVEAFNTFQAQFHEELNTAKNASLYVDFKEGRFSTPSEIITKDMVHGIATVNAFFLELTGPKVRMLQRIQKGDPALENTLKWFTERIVQLKESERPESQMESLLQELFERYRDEARGN